MGIFEIEFWRDTAERIVRSVGQGFITGLGGGAGIDAIGSTDIRALPLWAAGFSAAGMAVLTLATCLAASQVGDKNDASLRRTPSDSDPPRP